MHYVEAKSLLTRWNSINIYRGCTHGCIYCDSRSKVYQINHLVEDIEVKKNAPELLESILMKKRKKIMISTGSMSDPYMPIERKLQLTRKCLEIIDKYGFGATVITKSDLILRDLEILKRINKKSKCVIQMTLTTYDDNLCKILEPNVCSTKRRFEVLQILKENNIPTIVWFTPILPYINDTKENIDGIINYCIKAGVKGIVCFDIGLTLRDGNREYYYKMLDKYFPKLSNIYKNKYGNSYDVISNNNEQLMEYFHKRCEENNILHYPDDCFNFINEMSNKYEQVSLF